MRSIVLAAVFVIASESIVLAQDSLKVEAGKKAPPESVSAAIRATLTDNMYRIVDGQGRAILEIWTREGLPAATKPAGPKDAILYPFLTPGELLGACVIPSEVQDYRDQPISKGVYTLRYGLQPVNGDHLGVSTHRDYSLLVPAAKDQSLERLARKPLEEKSAEAAGTSHPAVFLLLAAPEGADRAKPSMVHDSEKNTWSVVFPWRLKVQGETAVISFPVRMVVMGAAQT